MRQVCGIWFPKSDTHFKLGMIDEQGNYQKDIFDAAMAHVKEPKIFYDIGAHVGLWSLMAHRAGFKHIEAYEPNPITYDCLQRNFHDASCSGYIHPYGISQINKSVNIINESDCNSGAVKLETCKPEDKSNSYCLSINNNDLHLYLEHFQIKPHDCLVKIDTEGMEADCVLGMDKILYALRPVVCVEQRTNHDALEILQKMGMEIVNKVRKDYILTWKNQ